MNVIVLVPAAGTGSRMQAGVNKQYLQLGERPILAHTLSLFDRHPAVSEILVITPREEMAQCRVEVVEKFGLAKVSKVVAGGAERQDSVRNGLEACHEAQGEDIVLVHDGVRPFFDPELIGEVVAAAARTGACVVGVPVKDTVKVVKDGLVQATPDRNSLWQAQTPQAFRLSLLRQAHRRAWEEGFRGTDDASLVERLGEPVAMVAGSYRNIKITTPEDLLWARAMLAPAGEEDS